jgi:nitrous oxidase accessory protein NosD
MMKCPCGVWFVAGLLAGAVGASAATLKVGAGATFARPSQAFAAAKEGDVIEIAGSYSGDVATIRPNQLTIRGVGNERAG